MSTEQKEDLRTIHQICRDIEVRRIADPENQRRGYVEGHDPVSGVRFTYSSGDHAVDLGEDGSIDVLDPEYSVPLIRANVADVRQVVARWIRGRQI